MRGRISVLVTASSSRPFGQRASHLAAEIVLTQPGPNRTLTLQRLNIPCIFHRKPNTTKIQSGRFEWYLKIMIAISAKLLLFSQGTPELGLPYELHPA